MTRKDLIKLNNLPFFTRATLDSLDAPVATFSLVSDTAPFTPVATSSPSATPSPSVTSSSATPSAIITISHPNTLTKNIQRWTKEGTIIRLKRGIYVTKEAFNTFAKTSGYVELIANTLRSPSYVSLEYVLSLHGILTEAIFAITSVTTKTKRSYENKLGKFTYRTVKPELFTGYTSTYYGELEFLMATKSKALFDYLYLKSDSLGSNFEGKNMVEELRLNLESFSKKDFEELRKYGGISSNSTVIKLIESVIKNASN